MITQVQFGNVFSSGSKNVIGGLGGSGFDTQALLEGLTQAKRLPAVNLEGRLEINAAKTAAYGELTTLLGQFKDAANFLRNPPGVNNASENIFNYRTASLSGDTTLAASNYLSVTAAPGSAIGNYDIQIGQLATHSIKTTSSFAATDMDSVAVGSGGPFNAGTLYLGPDSTEIQLGEGDTLRDVLTKVNAQKDTSGVEASAVKVSDGQYRITFKSTETGADANYDLLDPANTPVINFTLAVDTAALNAQVTIDGTTIERSTNTISDAIDGATINLLQRTNGGTVTANIDADRELAKTGILNFVNAYNELRFFASKQMELDSEGLPTENAILSGSSAMRSTVSALAGEMADIVDGLTDGDPSRLSDLGITFYDYSGDDNIPYTRNVMTVNEEKLESVLASDFDGVRKVFEFDYSSDSSQVQIYQRSNNVSVTNFSLNLDSGTSTYEASYTDSNGPQTVTLTAQAISGGGFMLTAPDDSALSGMVLLYENDSPVTANISMSQGIGDRVYNAISTATAEETGILTVEKTSITDQDLRLQKEIDRIDATVERFREQLLERFAKMEQAISQVNSLLQQLQAQADARMANS